MQLLQSLVSLVREASNRWWEFHTAGFEQAEVVDSAFAMSRAENLPG
ncbi:hypothetical protein AVDCRST_MAG94-6235 [uncultured Leptolyngbya sp.]|uniref:Uncharacterized protein n=1 Tax=uncultured Leptolyngbya sp. TaxID=332963 RepID=A0A6J4PDU5_9CYAN|nr:hypothetical protein AVDCRST_MAG94-6235 [uncultured Leptolyngbya sp.]